MNKCLNCSNETKNKKFCSVKCYGFYSRGKSLDRNSPSKKEYIQIRNEKGERMYLHRFNYEKFTNEILTEKDVIHHKDENKRNNFPLNLEKKTRAEHCKEHQLWKKRKNYFDILDAEYIEETLTPEYQQKIDEVDFSEFGW